MRIWHQCQDPTPCALQYHAFARGCLDAASPASSWYILRVICPQRSQALEGLNLYSTGKAMAAMGPTAKGAMCADRGELTKVVGLMAVGLTKNNSLVGSVRKPNDMSALPASHFESSSISGTTM